MLTSTQSNPQSISTIFSARLFLIASIFLFGAFPVFSSGTAINQKAITATPGNEESKVYGPLVRSLAEIESGNALTSVLLSPQSFGQMAKIFASDGTTGDHFGYSVAISGNTAVVGARSDNVNGEINRGSAYVLVRSGNVWVEQQKLVAADGSPGDQFGFSVAISGDTIVVGANLDDHGLNIERGAAYVFTRSGSTWTQQAKLRASDGSPGDLFGSSVGIDSNSVVVGAPGDDFLLAPDRGSAYVFTRSGSVWSEQDKISSGDGGDVFGISVSISGDSVLAGASGDDIGLLDIDQGSAYVYTRSGSNWTMQEKLLAPDGLLGDAFGHSVSLSGNTALIGAHLDDVGLLGIDQGSAYVFIRSGIAWAQQQKIVADDGFLGDLFGYSVSVKGDKAIVGAQADDIGLVIDQGSAYVLSRSGTSWSQQRITARDFGLINNFGSAVAIDGENAVLGADLDDFTLLNIDRGSAYFFADPAPLGDTTVTVSATPNPSVAGQTVTFTATVGVPPPGVGTPTGTVTFTANGTPICANVPLVGTQAQCSVSNMPAGTPVIVAQYSGDPEFNPSSGTLPGGQVINKANTALGLTGLPNPSVFGQTVTLTAAVTVVAPGSGSPTGTVTFSANGSPLCTAVALTSGSATCQTSAMPTGNVTVTAVYTGDANFNGSNGGLTGGPHVVNKANSAVAVISSQNPSMPGESVTFTATVSAVAPGSGTPTGAVTFTANGSPICTSVPLLGTQATCQSTTLPTGLLVIAANYAGDTNFNPSTGTLPGGQGVGLANTLLSLVSSANPSVSGQSVTFTATVSVVAPGTGTPTGTVVFSVNGSPVCSSAPLVSLSATCQTAELPTGNVAVTATYGGDSNFNGSSGSLTGGPQVVNKANSAVAVASSQNPSTPGQNVTFTATVSAVAPGSGTPTGTVTFAANGTPICTSIALSGAQATCQTAALPTGNVTITASYNGDGNFNPSIGTLSGGQTVGAANTTLALTSSANPSVSGQTVTFTSTISVVDPGTGTPTGSVIFSVNGSPVCSGVALASAIATCQTASLPLGNVVVTAVYGGDANFNGSNGSLTGGPQVVNKANSAVAVTSSQNPSMPGQNVTFTATVSAVAPGTGTPTGAITFSANGNPICTAVALSGAQATCQTSTLPTGNVVITAGYGGDSNFNPSTGTLSGGQSVGMADTTLALASSANPSVSGQSVTFTATISVVAPGTGTPTGTVAFTANGSTICASVALAGAQAQCTVSNLPNGAVVVAANYSGDTAFNPSSGTLSGGQTVSKANTTVNLTASPNPAVFGQSVTFTAAIGVVAPGSGNPTGTVNFSANGNSICTNAVVTAAQATCVTTALPTGNVTVTAVYGGDGAFNGSTGTMSGGGGLVVNKANTTTVITNGVALGTPTELNQAYPVNWTVAAVAPGAGTPTGTVTVSDGTDSCSANASAGTCLLTSSTAGIKSISASYGGDTNFNVSTSPTVQHTVNGGSGGNLTISGHVKRYPANGNLAGVTIALSGSTSASTVTDAGGNYSFANLTSGGSYVVTPSGSGRVFEPTARSYSNLVTSVSNANFEAFDTAAEVPREVAVKTSYVNPGQQVTLPVVMMSRGNERWVSMSVSYDPTILTPLSVMCGSGLPSCTLTPDLSMPGRIGLTALTNGAIPAGMTETAVVTFQVAQTTSSNTPVDFEGQPMAVLVRDVDGNDLPAKWADGHIVFAQGIESDAAGRFVGDGALFSTDVVMSRRFATGLDTPNSIFNEYQRVDASPRATNGNGIIDATDVVQARRYTAALDAPEPAAGPFGPVSGSPSRIELTGTALRSVRIGSADSAAGSKVQVPVHMSGIGDETAMSFTLNFDPSSLSRPVVSLGENVAEGSILTVNTNDAEKGLITVLIDSNAGFARFDGWAEVLTISFDVNEGAKPGSSWISFDTPDKPSAAMSNVFGEYLRTDFVFGSVEIGSRNSVPKQ